MTLAFASLVFFCQLFRIRISFDEKIMPTAAPITTRMPNARPNRFMANVPSGANTATRTVPAAVRGRADTDTATQTVSDTSTGIISRLFSKGQEGDSDHDRFEHECRPDGNASPQCHEADFVVL